MKNINYFRNLTAEAINRKAEEYEKLTLDFCENELMDVMADAANEGKTHVDLTKGFFNNKIQWDIVVNMLKNRGFEVCDGEKAVRIGW